MKVIHEYPVAIYKNEIRGYTFYKMGLYKKTKDGKSMYGYMNVGFKKDVDVDVSKKIYIQDAWIDFYIKDKITYPYIFINKFEYVSDVIQNTKVEKDPFEEFGMEIKDEGLPF